MSTGAASGDSASGGAMTVRRQSSSSGSSGGAGSAGGGGPDDDLDVDRERSDGGDEDGEGGADGAGGAGANNALGPVVAELSKGMFFGERALMTSEPRAATCIASSTVVCYALDRRGFEEVLSSVSGA